MDTSSLELRFKVGSIPVVVEPWFWLSGLLFMVGDLRGPRIALWLLVYFVSILVHELGHALVTHAHGGRADIRLHSFGGVTRSTRTVSRWRDILRSLAGPGAGFALGALGFALLRFVPGLPPLAVWTLDRLVVVNFAWGIMNLLPVPPLDGGHVLLSFLGRRHERTALMIGVAVAVLVALWGFSAGQTFLVILFGLFAYRNVQTLQAMSAR